MLPPAASSGWLGTVLEQFLEFIHPDSDLTDDRPQCSTIDFRMIRHHCLTEWIISAHDDMAAVLTPHAIADTRQSGSDLLPRNSRQVAHTATINASNFSSGTANPSSFSTSI